MKTNNTNSSEPDQSHHLEEGYQQVDESKIDNYDKLQQLLRRIIEEESVLALIDYIYYLEEQKQIYQIMFYDTYFKNFSEKKNNTLEDYNRIMRQQLDNIIKNYERYLKMNNYDKANEAKKIIDRRIASLEFLNNNFNVYYDLCINKGLEMLERKELIKEDISELLNLTNELINFDCTMIHTKRSDLSRIRN